MKLIIEYSENGEAVPDLKVREWLDELLAGMNNKSDNVITTNISVGTEVMIQAIRVAIIQERLKPEDVTIRFKNQEWCFDKNGRSETWPDGFCDTNLYYMEQLFHSL